MSAEVSDNYIQQAYGRPLKVGLKQRSARSFGLKWTVSHPPFLHMQQPDRVFYRAVVNMQNMKMTLLAVDSVSAGAPPRGMGHCVPGRK
ncbi:hypothetical protein ACUXV3_06170 [Roseobacteraceae bacterium NS-SX3]